MRRKLVQGQHTLLVERLKIGDIVLIERLGIFSQHDIAIAWRGRRGHAGAIAPEVFFFLFGGPIGLFLVGGAFDAQGAIRITGQRFGFVVAIGDVGPFIIFFDPGVDVFHVEGDHLAECRDLFFEIADGGMQKGLQQGGIKGTQFLGEPKATRERFLCIKAVGRRRVKMQVKAQLNDEQGMSEQKRAELGHVEHALPDADEKRLEVRRDGMAVGVAIDRAAFLPLLNDGPIQQGKESAVLLDDRIML
jgi:hypothetical protein